MLLLLIPIYIYIQNVTLAIITKETVAQDTVEVNVSAKSDVHTLEDHILKNNRARS